MNMVQEMTRRQHTNNNSVPSQDAQNGQAQTAPAANGTGSAPTAEPNPIDMSQQTPRPGDPNLVVMPPVFVNNPNMEFFMEVTPESITIDSLETTVVTSAAQADNGKFFKKQINIDDKKKF